MSARHSSETIHKIVAMKGREPSSIIAKRFGISRNAVIGIWWRAESPRISKSILGEMVRRGKRVRA